MQTLHELSILYLEGSLPSLPKAALEVLRVCQDPQASIDRLAQVLGRDPILASRVLRVANSAFYSRGRETTSLQRAALLLGIRALKVVALGFTLTKELPQTGAMAGLDLRAYWHRSIVTAVIARSLASSSDRNSMEEAFLCGLLSEIGKLALTRAMPERYAPVVAAGDGWPSDRAEREHLGFSASQVAEILLRGWGIPERIVLPIAFADRTEQLPDDTPDDLRRLTEFVQLAQLCAAVFFARSSGGALARFADAAERRHGLSMDQIETMVARIGAEIQESADVLSLDLPPGISYQGLLEQARLQMTLITVDMVVRLEETAQTIDVLVRENQQLKASARTDTLTGLPNRAALDEFLAQQVHRRLRDPQPALLGVLMIDVDHFKRVNDRFGHQAGDEALRSIAAAMQRATRENELLARYGGEEFCLVVPQATPETLRKAGERLRDAIATVAFDLGPNQHQHFTASFGGACLANVTAPGDGSHLVAAADSQLYRAKRAGRNRIDIVPEPVAGGIPVRGEDLVSTPLRGPITETHRTIKR